MMHPPAVFKGTLTTPSLRIDEGAIFEGHHIWTPHHETKFSLFILRNLDPKFLSMLLEVQKAYR